MRKSLLLSSIAASGALLCSLGASAIPIKVGLLAASGSSTWTSPTVGGTTTTSALAPLARAPSSGHGTVSLSGWENDDGAWNPATMIKNPLVPGLGIECNSPLDPACTGEQIGSDPQQIIDLDISALTGWTGLLITLDSVDGTNTGNLFGATCAPGDAGCVPTAFLAGCTTVEGSCTLSLTSRALTGITDIWITPVSFDPIVLDGELFVCTGVGPCVKPTAVPEPAAPGLFALGLLLIGTFLGLRRRRLGE